MFDLVNFLLALGLVCLFLGAFALGRQTTNLHRMEIAAAVSVAKSEVGWTYERYRIESLRMDWVAMTVEARKEYVRTWDRPAWAKQSTGKAHLD
jgi:hypothetical protein